MALNDLIDVLLSGDGESAHALRATILDSAEKGPADWVAPMEAEVASDPNRIEIDDAGNTRRSCSWAVDTGRAAHPQVSRLVVIKVNLTGLQLLKVQRK